MTPRLTKEESQELAKHIVAEMVASLSKEENVTALAAAWGKQLDLWIGRNFRRFLLLLLMVVATALAVKFEVWRRFGG